VQASHLRVGPSSMMTGDPDSQKVRDDPVQTSLPARLSPGLGYRRGRRRRAGDRGARRARRPGGPALPRHAGAPPGHHRDPSADGDLPRGVPGRDRLTTSTESGCRSAMAAENGMAGERAGLSRAPRARRCRAGGPGPEGDHPGRLPGRPGDAAEHVRTGWEVVRELMAAAAGDPALRPGMIGVVRKIPDHLATRPGRSRGPPGSHGALTATLRSGRVCRWSPPVLGVRAPLSLILVLGD